MSRQQTDMSVERCNFVKKKKIGQLFSSVQAFIKGIVCSVQRTGKDGSKEIVKP